MELTYELYEQRKHFPIVYGWWKAHRDGPIDIGSLGATGVVAYDGETPIAATWLFLTNSQVACMGWTVSNPGAEIMVISAALMGLHLHCEDICSKNGYTRILGFSSSSGLTKMMEREGFVKLVTHDLLIKKVGA